MFDASDILKLKTYCQVICMQPRPIDSQSYKREGIFLWCEDWEMIEILKYLFNGKDMYYTDPPPNRLKNNPLWSKDEIVKKAEALISKLGNVDKIITYFKEKRSGTS